MKNKFPILTESLRLNQILLNTKGSKKCGIDGDICKLLRMSLNMSESRRGIVAMLMVNLKTGKTSRRFGYFGGDFKKGMTLEFCPFCGKKPPELANK